MRRPAVVYPITPIQTPETIFPPQEMRQDLHYHSVLTIGLDLEIQNINTHHAIYVRLNHSRMSTCPVVRSGSYKIDSNARLDVLRRLDRCTCYEADE